MNNSIKTQFKPNLRVYVDYDQINLRLVCLMLDNMLQSSNYKLKSINIVSVQNRLNSLNKQDSGIIEYLKSYYNCEINTYGVTTGSNNGDVKLASICCIDNGRKDKKSKSKVLIVSSDRGFNELKESLELIGKSVQIVNHNELVRLAKVDESDKYLQLCILKEYVNRYENNASMNIKEFEHKVRVDDVEYNHHKRLAMLSRTSFHQFLSKLGFSVELPYVTGFSTKTEESSVAENKPVVVSNVNVQNANVEVSTKIKIMLMTKQSQITDHVVLILTPVLQDNSKLELLKQRLKNWIDIDMSNIQELFHQYFELIIGDKYVIQFVEEIGKLKIRDCNNLLTFIKFRYNSIPNANETNTTNLNDVLKMIITCVCENKTMSALSLVQLDKDVAIPITLSIERHPNYNENNQKVLIVQPSFDEKYRSLLKDKITHWKMLNGQQSIDKFKSMFHFILPTNYSINLNMKDSTLKLHEHTENETIIYRRFKYVSDWTTTINNVYKSILETALHGKQMLAFV